MTHLRRQKAIAARSAPPTPRKETLPGSGVAVMVN
jgi:hypothetical protein